MLFIFAFIISLVITMLLIPPIMKWADKIGAIDIPDKRKVHTKAIPRVGGIAMVIGSIVSIMLLADLNQQTLILILGFVIIWGFGIWDDKADLNYKVKFMGQILAVLIVVLLGDVLITRIPFWAGELPSYIAIPLTVFALVGVTNAINLSDGLDGLAGGTSLISISIIALLAYDAGGYPIVLISMAVAGSILGFLRHNTHPARLFMGDTGSQFLGFSIGILAIKLSQDVNTAMSPLIPLFILGLPILDTIAVMAQRIYEHRSPFSPDKNHIHHKLLHLGFSHYESVFIIYLAQSSMVAIAYFMLYESDLSLSLLYFVYGVLVFGTFSFVKKSNWKYQEREEAHFTSLGKLISYLKERGWLVTIPGWALRIIVPVILVYSAIFTEHVAKDLATLSIVLLAMFLLALQLRQQKGSLLEKAVVYIVAVMSVYQLSNSIGVLESYNIINILFFMLLIAFVLLIRFSVDRTFEVTPLDYLVIILVISVPNLPEAHMGDSNIGEMAIKLVILFYACEAIMGFSQKKWSLMRMGVLATLTITAIRSFL